LRLAVANTRPAECDHTVCGGLGEATLTRSGRSVSSRINQEGIAAPGPRTRRHTGQGRAGFRVSIGRLSRALRARVIVNRRTNRDTGSRKEVQTSPSFPHTF
jgi:hypothetical protein